MRLIASGALVGLTIGMLANPLSAQDPPPPGWYNTSELTAVWTGGNSPASTFGLKNDLRRLWSGATFRFEAGALRTEATTVSRSARGSASNFVVSESETSALTAESYNARGRYDQNLSERTFAFGGAGWNRNTFAGIQNRYAFAAGAGSKWIEREGALFKTDLGVTYTIQKDVIEDPTRSDSFAGLRFSSEAHRDLSATTRLASNLIVDENLDETGDLRADWTNSLTVAVSSNVALKTSYQILFDNEPSLVRIPLLDASGGVTGQRVSVPLNKTDGLFTLALVVNF